MRYCGTGFTGWKRGRSTNRYCESPQRSSWPFSSEWEAWLIYLMCVWSLQGNLYEFLRLTGWRGSKVLYFGDHIYSDLAVSSIQAYLQRTHYNDTKHCRMKWLRCCEQGGEPRFDHDPFKMSAFWELILICNSINPNDLSADAQKDAEWMFEIEERFKSNWVALNHSYRVWLTGILMSVSVSLYITPTASAAVSTTAPYLPFYTLHLATRQQLPLICAKQTNRHHF